MDLLKDSKLFANQSELAVSGLTLIECLVAIAVVAITTAAIGPMILFSVATKVQNQRVEQALRLAQVEINGIRSKMDSENYKDVLTAILPTSEKCIADTSAPTRFRKPNEDIKAVTDARLVDLDGDDDYDYAIQLFRKEILVFREEGTVIDENPMMFEVGARVYDAKRASPNLEKGLDTDEASLAFTSGEGQAGTRPLAVMYRMISLSERADLRELHKELDNAGSASACAS